MAYTFLATLAILYFMKFVAFLFMRTGSEIGVYSEETRLEDEFQATITQQLRGGLDRWGQPIPLQVIPDRPMQAPV
jgi:hypothetical protein